MTEYTHMQKYPQRKLGKKKNTLKKTKSKKSTPWVNILQESEDDHIVLYGSTKKSTYIKIII